MLRNKALLFGGGVAVIVGAAATKAAISARDDNEKTGESSFLSDSVQREFVVTFCRRMFPGKKHWMIDPRSSGPVVGK